MIVFTSRAQPYALFISVSRIRCASIPGDAAKFPIEASVAVQSSTRPRAHATCIKNAHIAW